MIKIFGILFSILCLTCFSQTLIPNHFLNFDNFEIPQEIKPFLKSSTYNSFDIEMLAKQKKTKISPKTYWSFLKMTIYEPSPVIGDFFYISNFYIRNKLGILLCCVLENKYILYHVAVCKKRKIMSVIEVKRPGLNGIFINDSLIQTYEEHSINILDDGVLNNYTLIDTSTYQIISNGKSNCYQNSLDACLI